MMKMTTCLWFDTQAEEAAQFYISVFKNGKIGDIAYYTKEGFEVTGKREGEVMTVDFEVNGMKFMGLNGGPHFKFNESVSLMIDCNSQKEIDEYTEKLTAGGGEIGPCGWVKDKFGLSWQVNPAVLSKMLKDPDKKKVERVTQAFLKMKKFDIAALERAFEGK